MEWLDKERNPSFSQHKIDDINHLSGARKKRDIFSPNADARKMNKSLIAYLLRIMPSFPHSTACKRGNSAVRNVERHRGNIHFFVTDLHDAYGSVNCERLTRMLCELDPTLGMSGSGGEFAFAREPRVADALLKACCIPGGGLIPGANASPALFNLYAGTLLDGELSDFCAKRGITYSRYLDDLTFSSREPIGERRRKTIRRIVARGGFEIAHHKSHVFDLRKGAIHINGVGITPEWRIFMPRTYLPRIKGLLYQYRRRNVPRELVAGTFGVFVNLTRSRMNRTEERLFSRACALKVAKDRRFLSNTHIWSRLGKRTPSPKIIDADVGF